MEVSVEQIGQLLLKGRLLEPHEVKGVLLQWQTEAGKAAGNSQQFCKWLAAKNHVTDYQAALLLRGHANHFFLNDYKILERISAGRMAGVYMALHAVGQVVAIKVLPPSRAKEPASLARFQREGRLAARLKHANIVRTFQLGESKGLHYLVMEYLEGKTLKDLLQQKKKLPAKEAVGLVVQVLEALQYIHEQGMVHRDLEPGNLMLVPTPHLPRNPTLKILDIGLGRDLFDENVSGGDQAGMLTLQGDLIGTPDYMAPEQAQDAHAADIRADIYSVGCILYHALTGQPPFPDKSPMSMLIRHATEPPKKPKELDPSIPDGLQEVVLRMLAKDPSQRFPTPGAAAIALAKFLQASKETKTMPALQTPGTKPTRPGRQTMPAQPTIPPPKPPEKTKARPTSPVGKGDQRIPLADDDYVPPPDKPKGKPVKTWKEDAPIPVVKDEEDELPDPRMDESDLPTRAETEALWKYLEVIDREAERADE